MATANLQALYERSRRLLEQNDIDRAIAVAQHILDYFPDTLETHRILGETYLASQQFEQAQEAFSRVLNADPENIPALVGLGITYERMGKLDRAVSSFEQALEIKPDMPELRSQLLRLYTEAWGSEGAQLRLSRAGLARLYAKGHMLPQAIQEFRSVISEHPERFDARVGLAEVFWRDGQEEAAAATCENILSERHAVLKANLLLGYIKLASGDPDGNTYWGVAQHLDPYQAVAHQMFDTLPSSTEPDTHLPEWDEALWQAERTRQEQERLRREAEEQQIQAEQSASVKASSDTDMFDGSWIDQPEETLALDMMASDGPENDNFLASLLAFESLDKDALADMGIDQPSMPSEADQYAQDVAAEAPSEDMLQPFDQVDAFIDTGEPRQPFTFDELGLSADELAALDMTAIDQSLQPGIAGDPLQPFSLDDLGLSADELAALDSITPAPQRELPADAHDMPDLVPFSLDDLDLSDEDVSRSDLAKTRETSLPSIPSQDSEDLLVPPFDWSLGIEDATDMPSIPDDDYGNDLPHGLLPFSLDDLDLGSGESDILSSLGEGSLPSSLQPFSLDDIAEISSPSFTDLSLPPMMSDEEDASSDLTMFGWQQPSAKGSTDFLRQQGQDVDRSERSIFAKLKQRRQEIPEEESGPLPPVSVNDDDELDLFSDDEVSLRDDDTLLPAQTESDDLAVSELQAAELLSVEQLVEPSEPELTPFSLEELGLSAEEIAALSAGEATALPPAAIVEEDTDDDELKIAPFSFDDIEFDDNEAFDIDDAGATSEDTEVSEDFEDIQPFSFDDLGLTDEELASLGIRDASEPNSELGLTEEELSGLSLGPFDTPGSAGIKTGGAANQPQHVGKSVANDATVLDQLLSLGRRQGYVDLTDIIDLVENPVEEQERIEEIGLALHQAGIEIRDGDEVIDMEDDDTDLAVDEEIEAEPVLTPFSLQDLGLSPEEIEALGRTENDEIGVEGMGWLNSTISTPHSSDVPAVAEQPQPEPEVKPVADIETVSPPTTISPDRPDRETLAAAITALSASSGAKTPNQPVDEAESFDAFDFSMADEDREKVTKPTKRTKTPQPEVEPVELSPEDRAFVPEPLDALDNIWDMPEGEDLVIAATPEPVASVKPAAETPRATAKPAAETPRSGKSAKPARSEKSARSEKPAQTEKSARPEKPTRTSSGRKVDAAEATPRKAEPSSPKHAQETFVPTGDETLDEYLRQAEAEPDNHGLRLAIARLSCSTGRYDLAIQEYKYLVKEKAMLDQIIDDVQDLTDDVTDQKILHRFYRLLGDAYSGQNRFREAIAAYSGTFSKA